MRIAVIGAGGIGGYFGGRLAASGADVTFLARGRHKEVIRRDGLRILSPLGDTRVFRAGVSDDPAEIGPVDILLVTVKLGSLEQALASCPPMMGPETAVVPLQNGVEAPHLLRERLGAEHACGGAAYAGLHLVEPGVVRHTGTMARLVVGELAPGPSPRLDAFAALTAEAGFETRVSADIWSDLWQKLAFLAPMAGTTCFCRGPLGQVFGAAETATLFDDLVAETIAVGRAEGVDLPEELHARTLALAKGLPKEMRSSMLGDLEAGRPLELDWLTGAVCRLGAIRGVPTPASDRVYAALAPFKDGTISPP